jgi:hypothetical protein
VRSHRLPGRRRAASGWRRLLQLILLIVVVGVAELLGWNLRTWFEELWDVMTGISAGYVIAGIVLITLRTTATA